LSSTHSTILAYELKSELLRVLLKFAVRHAAKVRRRLGSVKFSTRGAHRMNDGGSVRCHIGIDPRAPSFTMHSVERAPLMPFTSVLAPRAGKTNGDDWH
jgi:hypothetical protein